MKHKQAAVLLLALVLVIIVVQNSDVADIRILFWKISMSMIILIFFVALLGFAIGYLTNHFLRERKKRNS